MGRLQWYFNGSRQKERRVDTVERCKKIIRELESKNEDCIVVTHGFFMRLLIKCLKLQGYHVSNNKMGISNLHFIYAQRELTWFCMLVRVYFFFALVICILVARSGRNFRRKV